MAEREGVDWPGLRARIARAAAANEGLLHPDADEARRLLDERARKLARPLVAPSLDEHLELVCFAAGGERFAVETRYVAQVATMPEPERLPWVPLVFQGVVNHRGEALPVVDLLMLLTGTATAGAPGLMIVLGDPQPEIGIAIDAAEEVTRIPLAEVRTDGLSDALRAAGFVRGVHRAVRAVLDGALLLRDKRLFISEDP